MKNRKIYLLLFLCKVLLFNNTLAQPFQQHIKGTPSDIYKKGNNYIKASKNKVIGVFKRTIDNNLPKTLADSIGQEFLLDSSAVQYVPADNDQDEPCVSYDGTNYFVVWRSYGLSENGVYSIRGSRVDTTGKLLDSIGISISWENLSWAPPSIAYGNNIYFIAWAGNDNIFGSRVSKNGVLIDSTNIIISNIGSYYSQDNVQVLSVNKKYLVVWSDFRTGTSSIYGRFVDSTGTVLSPNDIKITSEITWQPTLCFDGEKILIAWSESHSGGNIYGAFLDTTGNTIDTFSISTADGEQTCPIVHFNGINYLVAWADTRNINSSSIYCARLTNNGVLLDTFGIKVSDIDSCQYTPMLTTFGTDYFVIWRYQFNNNSNSILLGKRISTNGQILDSMNIILTDSSNYVYAKPSIKNNYLVYSGCRKTANNQLYGGYSDINGVKINSMDMSVGPSSILSLSVFIEYPTSITYDGINYFVVSSSNKNSVWGVYGSRISKSSNIIDPSGFPITIDTIYNRWSPSTAFDGNNYLVAWMDARDGFGNWNIFGKRVAQSGTILDLNDITISNANNAQGSPQLTFNGTNYLSIWDDNRDINSVYKIYGTFISKEGNVTEPSGINISKNNEGFYPNVLWGASNHLVAWSTAPNSSFCAFVDTNGQIVDTMGISINKYVYKPRIAFNGNNYLVVFGSFDTISYTEKIYGVRISSTGLILDSNGFYISDRCSEIISPPGVCYDGNKFITMWDYEEAPWRGQIKGAIINNSGLVTDTFTFAQNAGIGSALLCRGDSNQILVAYSKWVDTLNGKTLKTWRNYGRFLYGNSNSELTAIQQEIIVYPNPYVPPRGHALLKISGMPDGSKIDIYNISGQKVWQGSAPTGGGLLTWDTKLSGGKPLATGLYIYIIMDKDGKVLQKGKWSVAR